MENLKQIQKLRYNANNIYTLFNSLIPKWDADKKHFDKTDVGFNIDSRFNACDPVSIAFASYCGVYGNSGCSTQCILDQELFAKHLVKYLNRNKKEVMLSIAKQIEQDALELKSKAEDELNTQLLKLKELESSVADLN